MKKLTMLFALSALALTACTESGTGQNTMQTGPQQQGTDENPFATTGPETEQAAEDAPVINTPIIQPEIEQTEATQPPIVAPIPTQPNPPTGNLDSSEFLNGDNADSANSIWVCSDTGTASEDEVVILAFFRDGSGIIGDEDTFEVISWTTNGPYLELYFNGQFVGQLDNVSASVSAGTFNASYVQPDGASGVLNCQLSALSDDDADVGGTPGGGSTGETVGDTGTTALGMLINHSSGNDLNTVWSCGLADGSSIALFFLVGGNGGFASDQYPDGISMSWSSSSQGVSLNLSDGNQISFSVPQFSSIENFRVENINILGVNVSGMDCQLVHV